jgi:hypothetical protein
MVGGMVFTVPGGYLRLYSSGNKAGNITLDITPGVGLRWKVLSIFIGCTNDATVATRTIHAQIKSVAGVTYQWLGSSPTFAATQSQSLQLRETVGVVTSAAQNYPSAEFGEVIIDDSTNKLTVYIANGVAGDTFNVVIQALEV